MIHDQNEIYVKLFFALKTQYCMDAMLQKACELNWNSDSKKMQQKMC